VGYDADVKFLVTVERDEDGMYVAECPAIPGCVSQGKTQAEALENIKDAIRGCLEVRRERGLPLTVPVHEVDVSV
jgi:predicted RNase H-like HicB family nuclease